MTAPLIKVYPADLGGCGHYRTIWPGDELARQGASVEVVMPTAPDAEQIQALWQGADTDDRRLIDVAHPEADVVVFQRPLTDTLAGAVPILQAKGVRVVVEIDDDFEAISPRNVSWASVDPAKHPRRNRDHLRRACEAADMVVCSTPALAERYARHGRVRVVRNRVPRWYLHIEREEHDGVFVGWSGSMETHPDDLQVTGGGVARAVAMTGATFAVIGTGRGVQRALGLASPPPACGWVSLGKYPYALAQLDIGIVPLEESPFNQAKSALKMMEMAAVGVVPIVSPTDENVRMTKLGVGMTAGNPRAWSGLIKGLVNDPDLRAGFAARSREAMRSHTIEEHVGEWFDAWSSAVNTRAKG